MYKVNYKQQISYTIFLELLKLMSTKYRLRGACSAAICKCVLSYTDEQLTKLIRLERAVSYYQGL